jgi:predicted esterase YcpF (UPF0227 family)
MIINLHGFNSAGNNNSCAQLKEYFEPEIKVISESYTVHNFKKGYEELIKVVIQNIESDGADNLLFVGSSTGALYAETLAKRFHGKVVLINPVTNPDQIKPAIGHHKNYLTNVEYEFTEEDWDTFLVADIDLDTERLVLFDKGDDVLNHELTLKRYEGHGLIRSFDGDSHRFSFWEESLPEIRKLYFLE